ncbi:tetratricopeptide repeat protein [Virgibacillus kekensis]|uniref:Tetratricopeptide repeat protein n=1 Tax=Virgibacillus kekensis TaxID=202261 RepID=A0ABV9DDV9_9BACI
MILYINFKIGMLYSMKNNTDESVAYHSRVIEMAGNDNPELKIKSLVSIAKTYGSKNQNEEAFPYLQESLELLDGSTLENTTAHAEALTEMAFYYFDQSKLDEAVPFYEQAIKTHKKLPYTSHRQLGMIYMQYAYCLEHMENENKNLQKAGQNYENAIDSLEKMKDRQLLENALGDVIAFFDHTNNDNKKRYFEERFVKMANA